MNWWKVFLALVVLWVLIGVVGYLIKGLFVLFVIACVLFGFTLAGEGHRRGYLRRR